MEEPTLRLGLVQMSAAGDDLAGNLDKACAGIREAAARGAQLVTLQELFRSTYFCQAEDPERFELAEPIPGPSSERLAGLARELGVSIVSSLFERRARGLYHNTALVHDPQGQLCARYRKMHIPDDPQFYEKFYFTPGDTGFVVADLPQVKLGPLVCWDQWYPEAARLTALRGAELLVYPTAIGWLPEEKQAEGAKQLAAWQTIQRSHAIANGVFVAAVNRVGFEPAPGSAGDSGIEFWGHSFVCDPFGEVIAEAGEDEEVLVVDCDLRRLEEVRRIWPFLRDRRVDAYGGIVRRFDDGTGT